MPVPVIGLTGGIATGESTVSNYFQKLGITIVDADAIAKQVVAPDSSSLKKIKAYFGSQIVLDNGELNRAELRKIIFSNESEMLWLNNLLHPLIRESMLTQLKQATSKYVILVAPLLFENGLEKYCNHTLLIDVPVDVQITRTTARDNVSVELAKQIIASQMSRADKQQKAGDILDNNRPLEEVKTDVQKLHEKYLKHSH